RPAPARRAACRPRSPRRAPRARRAPSPARAPRRRRSDRSRARRGTSRSRRGSGLRRRGRAPRRRALPWTACSDVMQALAERPGRRATSRRRGVALAQRLELLLHRVEARLRHLQDLLAVLALVLDAVQVLVELRDARCERRLTLLAGSVHLVAEEPARAEEEQGDDEALGVDPGGFLDLVCCGLFWL